MDSIYVILFWFALCRAPTSHSQSDIGKVVVRRNPQYYAAHGPSEYVRTMMKYNIAPTHPGGLPYQEIVSPEGRLLRRDVSLGLVGASLTPDSQGYKSPVTVGEGDHATTFELCFDTGSPIFWLFSDIADESLNATNSLYPLNSTTAKATGEQFNITYGGESRL